MNKHWILYGSELSPFTLKLKAIFDYRKIPYRFFPTEASRWELIKILARREALVRGLLNLTWPQMTSDDEYPLVPFLFGPNGENLYDSSAIARWVEMQGLGESGHSIFADDKPDLTFALNLLDEYADEYGLYMVHHNRWKVSAHNNNAGDRLAHEMRVLLGPLQKRLSQQFSARQTRRLPYLFSVPPKGFRVQGLRRSRQAPAHLDFPPTHDLLETSFAKLLQACEGILTQQAYLFGQRFSLADASIYGELGMNLKDQAAAEWIQEEAPKTYAWLQNIERGDFSASDPAAELSLGEMHRPLFQEVCRTYVPLMQQNLKAYRCCQAEGETLFNEEAFDSNHALYSGTIDGIPFKHVAKSFQAATWRKLRGGWDQLEEGDRKRIEALLPADHGLDRDE